MIFTEHHINLLLAGEKTQTRRLVKPGEIKPRYRPGKTYGIQKGRGLSAREDFRLLILSQSGYPVVKGVRQEFVVDISEKDAIAEGSQSAGAFLSRWTEINGRPKGDDLVWVYAVRLVPVRRRSPVWETFIGGSYRQNMTLEQIERAFGVDDLRPSR